MAHRSFEIDQLQTDRAVCKDPRDQSEARLRCARHVHGNVSLLVFSRHEEFGRCDAEIGAPVGAAISPASTRSGS